MTASLNRRLGYGVIAAVSAAAMTAILSLLTGELDEHDAKILGSAGTFAVAGLTAMSGGSLLQHRPQHLGRTIGQATIAASAITAAMIVAALWLDIDDETYLRTLGVACTLAFSLAHISLVLLRRNLDTDEAAVNLLTNTAVIANLVVTLLVLLMVIGVIDDPDEGYAKLIGVVSIITVACSAALPVLRRLQRGSPPTSDSRPTLLDPRARASSSIGYIRGRVPEFEDRFHQLYRNGSLDSIPTIVEFSIWLGTQPQDVHRRAFDTIEHLWNDESFLDGNLLAAHFFEALPAPARFRRWFGPATEQWFGLHRATELGQLPDHVSGGEPTT